MTPAITFYHPSNLACSGPGLGPPRGFGPAAAAGQGGTASVPVWNPVGLYTATASSGVDFDWLDRRSMEPVGDKRVNKVTGQEIAADDIVKGVEIRRRALCGADGRGNRRRFSQSHPDHRDRGFSCCGRNPLRLPGKALLHGAPLKRGEKVYALLREALRKSNKVGVAKVVIQSKQHLAVLIPCGRALVLNLPPLDAKAADIKDAEMAMAVQPIEDMTQPWDADSFRNSFAREIGKLVEAKASSGEIAQVAKVGESAAAPAGAQVIHLATLLKRSLSGMGATRFSKAASASVTQLPPPAKPGRAKADKSTSRRAAPAKSAIARDENQVLNPMHIRLEAHQPRLDFFPTEQTFQHHGALMDQGWHVLISQAIPVQGIGDVQRQRFSQSVRGALNALLHSLYSLAMALHGQNQGKSRYQHMAFPKARRQQVQTHRRACGSWWSARCTCVRPRAGPVPRRRRPGYRT